MSLTSNELPSATIDAIARAVAGHIAGEIADAIIDAATRRAAAASIAGDDALLGEDEAAAILSTRPKTLQHWRSTGFGPRIVRISPNRVAYRLGDLKAYIASAARGPVTPPLRA
jgi:hypothetical protein